MALGRELSAEVGSVDGSTSAGRFGSRLSALNCSREAGSATESLEDTFDSSASKEYTLRAEGLYQYQCESLFLYLSEVWQLSQRLPQPVSQAQAAAIRTARRDSEGSRQDHRLLLCDA